MQILKIKSIPLSNVQLSPPSRNGNGAIIYCVIVNTLNNRKLLTNYIERAQGHVRTVKHSCGGYTRTPNPIPIANNVPDPQEIGIINLNNTLKPIRA